MADNSGLVTIYDNTVPNKRMVTDRILNQNPYDIVAYQYLGTDMGKFMFVNKDVSTYEWLNDTYNDRTDVLVSGLASGTTTTTAVITTAALFQPGDVWRVETEDLWVSAISGTTITITRGFNGTTQATHADTVLVMTRISRARTDGDDADDSPSTEVSSTTNVTQIFQRTVNVSRSKAKINMYGISNLEDYEIDKYMDELMMDLARLPYYGGRSAGTENTVARSAGGFKTFLTTSVSNITFATSTGATAGTALALTRDHIDDTLALAHVSGGSPDLMLTVAHAQRKINSFYEGYVSTERSEQLGGVLIKKLMNPIDGKIIDVVVDRNAPSNEMWLLDTSKIAYYAFDAFFYERLAKTGDAVKGEIVGEYGFVVANPAWHGAVKEFSTSL
jgi:hypothetical protein